MALILGEAAYPAIGKAEYMQRFEPFFSDRQMTLLRAAYALSKEGHRSQVRADGHRYFDHVRACSWYAINDLQIHDSEMHNALLLHDIVEDTYLLTVRVIEMFFGEDTAVMVNLMTHRPGVSEADYTRNLRESARARAIGSKLIDRIHNMRTVGTFEPPKRLKKALETREHYIPLAEHLIEHVNPTYRWRAERLRDDLVELTDYWMEAAA